MPPFDCFGLTKNKKKNVLEYYVGLVEGDLVWGNTLPLVPVKYDTYYNYKNEHNDKSRETPSTSGNKKENHSHTPHGSSIRSHSTISELPLSQMAIVPTYTAPQKSNLKVHNQPSITSPYYDMMESQSISEPWIPLVVSEISLPKIHEQLEKKETTVVETQAVQPEKVQSKCSSKQLCAESKCVTHCKSKPCTSKSSTKKPRPGDITIAIKKKRKGLIVEGVAPAACNKEICELYTNKNLVPDKSENDNKDKPGKEQKFTVTAKENVEIIINKNKISIANNDKKKK